jgi:hypothetical protein
MCRARPLWSPVAGKNKPRLDGLFSAHAHVRTGLTQRHAIRSWRFARGRVNYADDRQSNVHEETIF